MKPQKKRMLEPATVTRARIKGTADQMAYEQNERIERNNLRADMKKRNMEARRKAATNRPTKASSTGANAGTYGGARGSLAKAFFGSLGR